MNKTSLLPLTYYLLPKIKKAFQRKAFHWFR
nr:MAG TPA: Helix 1, Belt helices 1,2,3,4-Tubulin Ring Complex, microtubule nucleation [Caudoviricetes sp.]